LIALDSVPVSTLQKSALLGGLQTVKKASQSFLRKQKIKFKSFLTAACTWAKILLRLQVWNLSAECGQIMRVADCKKLAEKPEGFFRQAQVRPVGRTFCISTTGKYTLFAPAKSTKRGRPNDDADYRYSHPADFAVHLHFKQKVGTLFA